MLEHFDPPRICLHDGGSICLVPRIRSTGILGPGIDLLVPRTSLGGDGIPRNTGRSEVISARNAPLEKACRFEKAKEEESGRCIKEMQRIVEWTEGAFQREGPLKATDGDCAIAVLLRGIKNSKAY